MNSRDGEDLEQQKMSSGQAMLGSEQFACSDAAAATKVLVAMSLQVKMLAISGVSPFNLHKV